MTITLGISAGFHDAAVSVLHDDKIVFASHSERYSRIKHDKDLCTELLREAFRFGEPNVVSYYEKPLLKKLRQLYAGQYSQAFYPHDITIKHYLNQNFPALKFNDSTRFEHHSHHLSHAAGSFQTSPFDRATVVVIDAIGEWDTISIYGADYVSNDKGTGRKARYKTLWKQRYPHSIGLFYSAMTQAVGLKPLDEEYIMMGMAAYGHSNQLSDMLETYVTDIDNGEFKMNLHCGILGIGDVTLGDTIAADGRQLSDWRDDLVQSLKDGDSSFPILRRPVQNSANLHLGGSSSENDLDRINSSINSVSDYDIAASAQTLVEILIDKIMLKAAAFGWSDNLCYSGGVALNCTANRLLGERFKNIWIMPNPGDAGSSLGAAALSYGDRLDWFGSGAPYLGQDIGTDQYQPCRVVDRLQKFSIAGVAYGRAEFGPRALGNRSLLADPRGVDIKDRVNAIKKRQKFRPFAPVILEEHVHSFFEMPNGFNNKGSGSSPYMQVVGKCRRPDLFPAIVHADGTSRVQTVGRDAKGSSIRKVLEEWYYRTDVPMLLNTSLNVRGEPMVNSLSDARRFEDMYSVKVFS